MNFASNIRLVNQVTNSGTLSTRILGIMSAAGQYVIQFDPDDSFTSNTILEQLSEHISLGKDIYHFHELWLINNKSLTDRDRHNNEGMKWANPQDYIQDHEIYRKFAVSKLSGLVHGKMIKTAVYQQAARFLENISAQHIVYVDDHLLMFSVCMIARSYQALNITGYVYNINSESILGKLSSNVNSARKYLRDNRMVLSFIYETMFSRVLQGTNNVQQSYVRDTGQFMKQMLSYDVKTRFMLCRNAYVQFIRVEEYFKMINDMCGRIEWDQSQMMCYEEDQ
ncbi:Glycosyl_transferase family 2 protein [Hexamita inflata]|uniref:Glycosyl_transferase family 2 protein n=1 Tax=Hexamita inflata TaxID=28002 RepID=A0ABP1H6V0_9EUKA